MPITQERGGEDCPFCGERCQAEYFEEAGPSMLERARAAVGCFNSGCAVQPKCRSTGNWRPRGTLSEIEILGVRDAAVE